MWFNILKNEGRRAAYRLYINSLVHLGKFIPPTPLEVRDNEHNVREFTSSNGHFSWLVMYLRGIDEILLIKTPDSVEPHKEYIQGMFENEYPEHYAALQKFFMENKPRYQEEREEDDSPSPKKKTIRKIMRDWNYFMDSINSYILGLLRNAGFTPRDRRLLQNDIDPALQYKEVRDYIHAGPGLGTKNLPLATLRAIQATYAKSLQTKNPDIVWENFINFVAHFREEYMQHISYMANSQGYTDEDAVHDVTPERMYDLARNIWRNNPNDVETLMNQLPNYN